MDMEDKIVVAIIDVLKRGQNHRQSALVVRRAAGMEIAATEKVPRREVYQAIYALQSRNMVKEKISSRLKWLEKKGVIEKIRYSRFEPAYALTYSYLIGEEE